MAHNLPKNDTFANNALGTAGPRWTKPTLYWPTKLWNNASESATSFNTLPDYSILHDGYKTDGTQACMRVTSGGARVGAFTFMPVQREDVSVQARFRIRLVQGDDTHTQGAIWCGVIARLVGESGTQLTASSGIGYEEALTGATYYAFVRGNRPGIGSGYQLWRVTGPAVAGNDSTIDVIKGALDGSTNTFGVPAPNITTEMAAGRTFGMRLRAVTNGAVCELTGYWIDELGNETEVISYDDGDSPAILEEGHAGMLLTTEMSRNGGDDLAVMGAVSFQVSSDDLTVIDARDEFQRTMTRAARRVTDRHSTRGHAVTGRYTGDQAGEDQAGQDPDWADRLTRDASNEYLVGDGTVDNGWHLAMDPAENRYTQARSATFTPVSVSGATPNLMFGVGLRMSIGEDGNFSSALTPSASGYMVSVVVVGATFALRLHRYNGLGGPGNVVVAFRTLNQSGDPVTVAMDSQTKVSFAIENRDGPSAANGNVHLDIQLDDTKLTGWTRVTGKGILEEDDGTLTDISSDRVLSGEGEGFYFHTSATEANPIRVHSFTDDEPVFVVAEQEQDSVFLTSEQEGVTGTLTVPHEWPVVTRWIDYRTAIQLDSSHVHRHRNAQSRRRVWVISSRAAKASEVSTLRTFFADHEGAVLPFNWTTPEGEAVVARLITRSLSIRKRDIKTYAFEVHIMECLGAATPFSGMDSFASSAVAAAVGGFSVGSTPSGAKTHPVFHFQDTDASIDLNVTLDASPDGVVYVGYKLTGTAVEGTHYSVESGSQSPLRFEAGQTEATLTLIPIATGEYHPEKQVIISLDAAGSTVPIKTTEPQVNHAFIRSTTAPPDIEFSSASQGVSIPTTSPGETVTFTVQKASGASAHSDRIRLWLEADSTSTAVERQDYVWLSTAGEVLPSATNGHYSIAAAGSNQTVSIRILPTASASTLKINLVHELNDESEKNHWTYTRDWRLEARDSSGRLYPRVPADNNPGPFSILPPDPVDIFTDAEVTDPYGQSVQGLETRDDARGSPYMRKSSESWLHGAGPDDHSLIAMPQWMRFSVYVDLPTVVNGRRNPPRFIRLGFRDRGFQLAAPQEPPGATTGTATSANAGTVLTDSGADFVAAGVVAGWKIRNTTDGSFATVISATTTTVTHGALGSGTNNDWEVGDAYAVYADQAYDQNYGVVFDRESPTGTTGVVSHATGEWSVFFSPSGAGDPTPQNMLGNSDWGIEEETWRKANGTSTTLIRLWVLLEQTDATRIGDACNVIWWPTWFNAGDGTAAEAGGLSDHKGKAMLFFWPLFEHSNSSLPATLPRAFERPNMWWQPRGGATLDSAGTNQHTITIS